MPDGLKTNVILGDVLVSFHAYFFLSVSLIARLVYAPSVHASHWYSQGMPLHTAIQIDMSAELDPSLELLIDQN